MPTASSSSTSSTLRRVRGATLETVRHRVVVDDGDDVVVGLVGRCVVVVDGVLGVLVPASSQVVGLAAHRRASVRSWLTRASASLRVSAETRSSTWCGRSRGGRSTRMSDSDSTWDS